MAGNSAKRTHATGALSAAAIASRVMAQDRYPSKRSVFSCHNRLEAGADVLVRTLQPKMQELLGQTIVVGNKPGNIGSTQAG